MFSLERLQYNKFLVHFPWGSNFSENPRLGACFFHWSTECGSGFGMLSEFENRKSLKIRKSQSQPFWQSSEDRSRISHS